MRNKSLFVLFFSLSLFFSSLKAQVLRIPKLELQKKKEFYVDKDTSFGTLAIDTLIMNDQSRIIIFGKKEFNIEAKNAFIGRNCLISGHDRKNNGTNLNIRIRFNSLGKLEIQVNGENRMNSHRDFGNGNGGDVHLYYDSKGEVPQTENARNHGYLVIHNSGAIGTDHPEQDLDIIKQEIRSGNQVPFRPLTNVKQGLVFDAKPGKDGVTEIKTFDF